MIVIDRTKVLANQTSSSSVASDNSWHPEFLKLILLYGRKNVNTAREQYADYSTRRATTCVINAVRHLARNASSNLERNGFNVKVALKFSA